MQVSSIFDVGAANTPQEIKRLRRQTMDICRRMGQPVIFRHMWDRDDVKNGLAIQCPACFNTYYDQVRNDCLVCFGFGFVSTEFEPTDTLFINNQGEIVEGDPGTGVRAPRYGGFDKAHLTWIIEPDIAVDVFRINEQGVMIRTYDATGSAPWSPDLGDNDLCINVVLDNDGFSVQQTNERFQLKMVQNVTVRGFGKLARNNGGGQVYLVGQTFQMSHGPEESSLYDVPVDPDGIIP